MFCEIGQRYVINNTAISQSPLMIGYGSKIPEKNFDPWGEDCHVAIIGHSQGGGPRIIGAGCPIAGENKWYPIYHVEGNYAFRDRRITFIDMVYSVASGRIVITESLTTIPYGRREFFNWLGFLLHLEKHPEGLVFE